MHQGRGKKHNCVIVRQCEAKVYMKKKRRRGKRRKKRGKWKESGKIVKKKKKMSQAKLSESCE